MKIRVPDYYDEFKCIADKCTDTCCAGWQVDVDDKSFAYYKTIKGEFGDRLHSVMIEGKHGEEGQFRIREDGRCPFLNDNMFCDLYTALGEDALCVTCDKYPRYTTEYGNLRETGIAISCITAAGIVLRKRQNFGFKEWEDKEAFPSLNNIDGELFMALMRARTKAFEIIHDNSSADIFQRISVLAYYATDLQKNIKKESGMDNVISRYSEEYINDILAATGRERYKEKDTVDIYKNIFYCYLKQVIIKAEWPELIYKVYDYTLNDSYGRIRDEFKRYNKDSEYEYENLIDYFIFRYFMKAVFDRDILTKVKMGIVGVLVIHQCNMAYWCNNGRKLEFDDIVEIAHLYSREVEHSEENFDRLCRQFSKKRTFCAKNLVMLLQDNSGRKE